MPGCGFLQNEDGYNGEATRVGGIYAHSPSFKELVISNDIFPESSHFMSLIKFS